MRRPLLALCFLVVLCTVFPQKAHALLRSPNVALCGTGTETTCFNSCTTSCAAACAGTGWGYAACFAACHAACWPACVYAACAADTTNVTGSGSNGAGTCEALDGSYTDSTAICLPDPPFYYFACSVTVPCCSESGAQQIIEDAFDNYRKCFIMDSFYKDHYLKEGLQPWATTLRNAFMLNSVMKGMIIDASNMLSAMLDMQKQAVQTAKNYAPSEEICRIGTLSRGLTASDAHATAAQLVISQAGLARNLGTMFSVGASGRGDDSYNRISEFVDQFCDISDNKSGLDELCKTGPAISDASHNRDIDYARSVDARPTLKGSFTDSSLQQDESNIFALGNYLYGHWQPLKRDSLAAINEKAGSIESYNEYRSIVARRAAAQNTFAAIASMRASGSGSPDEYIAGVLQRLGLNAVQIMSYAAGSDYNNTGTSVKQMATSYNGQMEMLTRKIYQDPAFYANLMDSAANIKRTSAAMGGIGLMQDRDIYKSTTRSEMLLALLVELEAHRVADNEHSARLK